MINPFMKKFISVLTVLLVFTPALAASTASWSTPVNLSDWQVRLNEPWVHRGADGTQAIFWMQPHTTLPQDSLWARVRTSGGEGSTAQDIFGWQEYQNFFPQFGVAPDGTVWVLWTIPDLNQTGDNLQVKIASWSGSGPWQIETLSEYETTIRNIDLSLGPDGHLAATWVACASLSPYINGPCALNIRRRFPGASVWELTERLDALTGMGILYGRSLVGPGGMVVTTWGEASQTITDRWHVMTRAYDPALSTWESSPIDVSGVIRTNMWPFLAQPVMGSDGTVIAAWYKQDPADYNKADLYSATRQASTGTWNSPVPISNIHDAGLLSVPKLAVGQNGTAVIAWEQKKSGTLTLEYAVFANVCDPGDTWGTIPPTQVSDYFNSIDLAAPQVWPDGSMMLLWEAQDDSRDSKEDETILWNSRSPSGTWGDIGQGQLGGWYDSIDGTSVTSAIDGSISVLWGIRDGYQPVDQRAKVQTASWAPGAVTITVDTLQSGYSSVDLSDDSIVGSDDGQTRAAAWLTQKSATSPSDPQYAVFYAEDSPPNTAPIAAFTVAPPTGTISTNFQFDASTSSDNEDPSNALEVHWDWEDDGTFDTNWSTTKTENHQYSAANTYQVRLEVRDTGGLTESVTRQLAVTSNGGGGTVALQVFIPMVIR